MATSRSVTLETTQSTHSFKTSARVSDMDSRLLQERFPFAKCGEWIGCNPVYLQMGNRWAVHDVSLLNRTLCRPVAHGFCSFEETTTHTDRHVVFVWQARRIGGESVQSAAGSYFYTLDFCIVSEDPVPSDWPKSNARVLAPLWFRRATPSLSLTSQNLPPRSLSLQNNSKISAPPCDCILLHPFPSAPDPFAPPFFWTKRCKLSHFPTSPLATRSGKKSYFRKKENLFHRLSVCVCACVAFRIHTNNTNTTPATQKAIVILVVGFCAYSRIACLFACLLPRQPNQPSAQASACSRRSFSLAASQVPFNNNASPARVVSHLFLYCVSMNSLLIIMDNSGFSTCIRVCVLLCECVVLVVHGLWSLESCA